MKLVWKLDSGAARKIAQRPGVFSFFLSLSKMYEYVGGRASTVSQKQGDGLFDTDIRSTEEEDAGSVILPQDVTDI